MARITSQTCELGSLAGQTSVITNFACLNWETCIKISIIAVTSFSQSYICSKFGCLTRNAFAVVRTCFTGIVTACTQLSTKPSVKIPSHAWARTSWGWSKLSSITGLTRWWVSACFALIITSSALFADSIIVEFILTYTEIGWRNSFGSGIACQTRNCIVTGSTWMITKRTSHSNSVVIILSKAIAVRRTECSKCVITRCACWDPCTCSACIVTTQTLHIAKPVVIISCHAVAGEGRSVRNSEFRSIAS